MDESKNMLKERGLRKEDEMFTARKKCRAQFIRSKTSSAIYG